MPYFLKNILFRQCECHFFTEKSQFISYGIHVFIDYVDV